MNRVLELRKFFLIPPLLFSLSGICFAQADTPPATVVTELASGLFRIHYQSRVSLVAFTGQDGLMLVDAGYERSDAEIRKELDAIGAAPLRYIVNTHWHGDHTGGNIPLGRGADIIAHDQVREMLSHDQHLLGKDRPASPENAWPDITFSDRMTIRMNREDVGLIHLEGGHTGGDILVWFPSRSVLVMGDLVFADRYPFVDLEHGGNALRYVDNLKWVTLNYPADIAIVPGHGRMYTMDDLKKYQEDLRQTIAIISRKMDEGMTAGQMKENRILSAFETYGEGWIKADDWIDTVVRSRGE